MLFSAKFLNKNAWKEYNKSILGGATNRLSTSTNLKGFIVQLDSICFCIVFLPDL